MTYFRPPTIAGAVVPFKPKSGVLTIPIGGRKYVLSTDGGPLGDREDDDLMGDSPLGARLIRPPSGADKWRYLWCFDTDRKTLTMWRVSDGNEKLSMSASSAQAKIVALEKKGQLNRVTHDEFSKVEREMREREQDQLAAMQMYVESMKSDATKQLDRLVRDYFEETVLPKLLRGLKAVRNGVTPIGFRPFGPATEGDAAWLLRQKSSHVMGEVFRVEMPEPKVEAWIRAKGFDLELVGNQDLQWAIDDVRDSAAQYLPERPDEG